MINNPSINERILQIIVNQYNNNQKKFAESIGYSAQVIFNIVSGRKTKPSFEVLNAIISTNDDIDAGWLLTGRGSMLKSKSISLPVIQQEVLHHKDLADSRLETIELLRDKINSLNSTIKRLEDNGSSVQRGTMEFLNEPPLERSSGK